MPTRPHTPYAFRLVHASVADAAANLWTLNRYLRATADLADRSFVAEGATLHFCMDHGGPLPPPVRAHMILASCGRLLRPYTLSPGVTDALAERTGRSAA